MSRLGQTIVEAEALQMEARWLKFVASFLVVISTHLQLAHTAEPSAQAKAPCTVEIPIDGAISTAADDFLARGIARTEREKCVSILITLNTPGGSLQTTRIMVERIMAATVPVFCVVAPEGGHAGSAGALILLACHVAGALPATNIGAATPISGGGNTLTDDLRQKLIEDTKAWAVSLAKKRNRSVEFAEKIITEAKAYDVDAALKIGAIDIRAGSVTEFFEQSSAKVQTVAGERILMERDLRELLLSLIADPEFSYLLFMAALALLYFEITHPGAIAPGVIGALLLVVSLIAFHKLEVVWGGVGLMVLGIGFLIAEAFVPSFGALGIGGIVALGAGSILLYDPASGGLSLSLWLALGVPLTLGMSLLGVGIFLVRSRRSGGESLAEAGVVGVEATVDHKDGEQMFVTVRGEIWRVQSYRPLAVGDRVRIVEVKGMHLVVLPLGAAPMKSDD